MGLQSGDVTDGPLCFDNVPPVITAKPSLSLRNDVGPVGASVPTYISWNGTDATSGVNHFTVYQSKDGGAFSQIASTSVHKISRSLPLGHTYQFEVTATDNAGNTSAVSTGKVYTLSVVQENSSTIKYSTGWKRQTLSGANGGSVEYASTAGDTATLSFTGNSQVAWMSTKAAPAGPRRSSWTAERPRRSARTPPASRPRRSLTWSRRRLARTSWSSRCSAPPGTRGWTSMRSSS